MKKKTRYAFIHCYIGHNGTGKTPTAKQFVAKYKEANPQRSIIAFDPQDYFRDLADEVIIDEEWEQYENRTDILFLLDDYRGLMVNDKMNTNFMKLLQLRNRRRFDFIVICHHPSHIIERLSHFVTHFFIFYSMGSDNESGFKGKTPCRNVLVAVKKYIDRYVKDWGRGTYPKFPHILVNPEKETVEFYNMPKAKK